MIFGDFSVIFRVYQGNNGDIESYHNQYCFQNYMTKCWKYIDLKKIFHNNPLMCRITLCRYFPERHLALQNKPLQNNTLQNKPLQNTTLQNHPLQNTTLQNNALLCKALSAFTLMAAEAGAAATALGGKQAVTVINNTQQHPHMTRLLIEQPLWMHFYLDFHPSTVLSAFFVSAFVNQQSTTSAHNLPQNSWHFYSLMWNNWWFDEVVFTFSFLNTFLCTFNTGLKVIAISKTS